MTNNTINVPRELLENIVLCYNEGEFELGTLAAECHALLSAPSPAGVEGLEVVQAVAWLNTATKEATTHPVVVMDWDDEKEPVESLMPISQHEAIIDGLRGENERIRLNIAEYNEAIACYQSERDQHSQRIGELEGLLRVVHGWIDESARVYRHNSTSVMLYRIDAALSSGKEGE